MRAPWGLPPEDKGSSSSMAQHILGVKGNFPNYNHVWFCICRGREDSHPSTCEHWSYKKDTSSLTSSLFLGLYSCNCFCSPRFSSSRSCISSHLSGAAARSSQGISAPASGDICRQSPSHPARSHCTNLQRPPGQRDPGWLPR